MLEVIGAAPGSHTDIDWHETWKASPEREAVKQELARLEQNPKSTGSQGQDDKWAYKEFAAPLWVQFKEVQKRYVLRAASFLPARPLTFDRPTSFLVRRVFQQYWRSPTYIYSKIVLCTLVPLFIGFSFFDADTSQQGLQNQLFAVFMLFTGSSSSFLS